MVGQPYKLCPSFAQATTTAAMGGLFGPRQTMPTNFQVPYALAMILADMVYADPATGKVSILGSFSAIHAHSFPATYPLIAVYLALTDGRGQVPIRFRLVDADEGNVIFEHDAGQLQFLDPRAIMDLVIRIQNAAFPAPGEYRLQIWAESESIMERRLDLIQIPQSQLPQGETR